MAIACIVGNEIGFRNIVLLHQAKCQCECCFGFGLRSIGVIRPFQYGANFLTQSRTVLGHEVRVVRTVRSSGIR